MLEKRGGDNIHHAVCDARASSKTSFVVFFLVASKHRDIYLSYLVKWNSIQLVDTGRNESPNCITIIVGQITLQFHKVESSVEYSDPIL